MSPTELELVGRSLTIAIAALLLIYLLFGKPWKL